MSQGRKAGVSREHRARQQERQLCHRATDWLGTNRETRMPGVQLTPLFSPLRSTSQRSHKLSSLLPSPADSATLYCVAPSAEAQENHSTACFHVRMRYSGGERGRHASSLSSARNSGPRCLNSTAIEHKITCAQIKKNANEHKPLLFTDLCKAFVHIPTERRIIKS